MPLAKLNTFMSDTAGTWLRLPVRVGDICDSGSDTEIAL